MFGIFKKQCQHKNRKYIGADLTSQGIDQHDNYVGDVIDPIYVCRDCRVLFLPLDKQRIEGKCSSKAAK